MGLQGKSFCLALAAITLSSFNMCFLEQVAAKPHSHESASHHEDSAATNSDSHAHDTDHAHEQSEMPESPCESGDVVCCENIVAVQPTVSTVLANTVLNESIYLAHSAYRVESAIKRPQYNYQIDFSPGTSPPTAFLFAHTNHAPPLHA